jgi:3-oxoacyl-[acyl-carrier protein] reductase
MKQRKRGAVVTISSAAARRPHPGSPIPYAAAKAGIIIMAQDLAAQVGAHNIRTNWIAPETILTEGNRERIPSTADWITGIVLDVAGGAVMARTGPLDYHDIG